VNKNISHVLKGLLIGLLFGVLVSFGAISLWKIAFPFGFVVFIISFGLAIIILERSKKGDKD
jgi:hypothetical protein